MTRKSGRYKLFNPQILQFRPSETSGEISETTVYSIIFHEQKHEVLSTMRSFNSYLVSAMFRLQPAALVLAQHDKKVVTLSEAEGSLGSHHKEILHTKEFRTPKSSVMFRCAMFRMAYST